MSAEELSATAAFALSLSEQLLRHLVTTRSLNTSDAYVMVTSAGQRGGVHGHRMAEEMRRRIDEM